MDNNSLQKKLRVRVKPFSLHNIAHAYTLTCSVISAVSDSTPPTMLFSVCSPCAIDLDGTRDCRLKGL